MWDVTCSDIYTYTHLHIRHINQVERRKASQYSHLEVSHFFAPVSVETSGAMGTNTLRLLREIAHRIVTRSGEPNAYQPLIQRILVSLQRGNMISIMETFKPSSQFLLNLIALFIDYKYSVFLYVCCCYFVCFLVVYCFM